MAHTTSGLSALLNAVADGHRPAAADALALLPEAPFERLLPIAESLALLGFGQTVTYSRKVFIPLTQLCRDVCHYCTFAKAPRHLKQPYLGADDVLAIARAGKAADCKEALFTLGDQPEARYSAARAALDAAGAATTLEYLERMARLVLQETGLLPHLNPGVMSTADLQRLRPVSASMGLMLESNLNPGKQTWQQGKALAHGVSITDACLGWDETAALLNELSDSLVTRPA